MLDNFREFQAGPDPFGRTWRVHFDWLQNGISIRHADTVDVKFAVSADGAPFEERILALPHPALLAASKQAGHALTDAWCLKIAALHLQRMLLTGEDLEKTLVTVPESGIEQHAREIKGALASAS